jgi:sugar/nucleoside kinase (ribokinase family)
LLGLGINGINMNDHDVYAYGVISTSTMYLLKDEYPARSGYAEIATKYKNIGGEAANAAIVLSRLGLSVRLDGNWINPDEDAQHLQDVFNENRVDISRVSFRKCQGPKEMLVVDATSRTIYGTYAQLLAEQSWNLPRRNDVQKAKIVCLDPFFGDASVQVANHADDLGKPVVTVDCKYDDPVFLASEAAIISEEFLKRTYRLDNVSSITREYQKRTGGTVIFTFGQKEIIHGTREEGFRRFAPFRISPVDTTGAGDSFRAGIVFGLLRKWPAEQMIEFASALAAIVCQSFPGVLHSPSYDEVKSFLRDQGSGEHWA